MEEDPADDAKGVDPKSMAIMIAIAAAIILIIIEITSRLGS